MSSSTSSIHFFKIFFQEPFGENKLHIPNKFTRKYGETLSNSVLIKLPCGSKWKMELTKKDKNIYFDKGWLNFANHYGIKKGSLITFRYEGNSEFYAVIFDSSTGEIEYPSIPPDLVRTNTDSELKIPKREVAEEGFIEILEEQSSPCSQPHKKMRTQTNPSSRKLETETNGKHNLDAAFFKSSRPFFTVVMKPYYVHGHTMNIPCWFAKKYLGATYSNAILKLSNGCGRTWSVEYKFGVYGKQVSSRFQTNWRAFVHDNNLRIGDACVFVMLEDIDLTFEVVISPVSVNSETFMSPEHKDAMDGETVKPSSLDNLSMKQLRRRGKLPKRKPPHFPAIEKAKLLESVRFKSENPFFKLVIQPSYLKSGDKVTVPLKFAMAHLKEGTAIVSISNGGSWPVRFKFRQMYTEGRLRFEFTHGWKEFVKANDLKVGDVCVFELLKKSENSLRVLIVRVAADANHHKSQVGGSKPKVEVGEQFAEFF